MYTCTVEKGNVELTFLLVEYIVSCNFSGAVCIDKIEKPTDSLIRLNIQRH